MATEIKFYKSEIANQPIQKTTKKGKYTISFIVCEIIAQSFRGVYKTEDADEQEVLDSMVGTRGLSEIDQKEYDHWLKKKTMFDSRTPYLSRPIQAQPQSNSVATAPDKSALDDKGAQASQTTTTIPLPTRGTGIQDNKEGELSGVEQVTDEGAAPQTAANYTQLATKLSESIGVPVTADELKELKDRPDAPKRVQGKGISVLEWKAFLTKVAGEQEDPKKDEEEK